MNVHIFNCFEEFLETVNIKKAEEFDFEVNYEEEDWIVEHLKILNEFHKKTLDLNVYISRRINNYTGKKIEEFKVDIKRLKRDFQCIKISGAKCEYEKIILEHSPRTILWAENCINNIYKNGYYDLIKRSMDRREVCLGVSDEKNIMRRGEYLDIIDTKHIGYNMVEFDAINFFNKLKKKKRKFDYKNEARKFCEFEGLSEDSENFICAATAYPSEFMKSVNRYRNKKKNWTEDKYVKNLMDAIVYDEGGV